MSNQNHIVILTPGFAKNEADTVCIPALQLYLKNYVRLFPADKISVIAFEYPYFAGVYSWNGITIYSCGGGNNRIKRFLTLWRARSFIKKLHKEHPITCLHSFWLSECSVVGHRFSALNKIPHLITLMGQDALKTNSYIRKSELLTEPIIALSRNHSNLFRASSGIEPRDVIPWGIDPSEFPAANENTPDRVFSFDVIGVGNLTDLKNYGLFIDCINEVRKAFPAIKVGIIGIGPQHDLLQKKINELDLSKNISLLGGKGRAEVLSIMGKSKVLLHTSSYESFGYVFSEALASGAAIVSFDVGWATQSEQWRVCKDKSEIIQNLKQLLTKHSSSFLPFVPHLIEKTVKIYRGWYTKSYS
jgi:glycosyltransferase involved in cell wall biosynthesis